MSGGWRKVGTIAGHTFNLEGRCDCGKRWADIAGALPENVGQEHWAHFGKLNDAELREITEERNRIWKALEGVCAP